MMIRLAQLAGNGGVRITEAHLELFTKGFRDSDSVAELISCIDFDNLPATFQEEVRLTSR